MPLVLAVTPGPGIAYVVARTAAGARSEGLASCLGTALGGMLHVLAASVGLSAVLAQSASTVSIVKYAGAAYLVYLGLRLVLARQAPSAIGAVAPRGARRALRDGVVVEALNVKTAIFFLAFLPQFVSASEPLVPQLRLLGTICVLLNTAVDVVAALAASRFLESSTARAAHERRLSRISGCTLIGFSAYLATANRETCGSGEQVAPLGVEILARLLGEAAFRVLVQAAEDVAR